MMKAAVKAEAKLLEEREKYGQEVLPEGAHKVNKHYKPWEVAAPQKEVEIKAEKYSSLLRTTQLLRNPLCRNHLQMVGTL